MGDKRCSGESLLGHSNVWIDLIVSRVKNLILKKKPGGAEACYQTPLRDECGLKPALWLTINKSTIGDFSIDCFTDNCECCQCKN